MRRIVAASLRFRSIIIAMAAALMIVGGAQLSSASVDVFPEFAPPRVEVQTACLGLTASEVEELVTVPMEQAFNGIDGLDQMRSKSVSQLSAIVMEFKPGTDLLTARQLELPIKVVVFNNSLLGFVGNDSLIGESFEKLYLRRGEGSYQHTTRCQPSDEFSLLT